MVVARGVRATAWLYPVLEYPGRDVVHRGRPSGPGLGAGGWRVLPFFFSELVQVLLHLQRADCIVRGGRVVRRSRHFVCA